MGHRGSRCYNEKLGLVPHVPTSPRGSWRTAMHPQGVPGMSSGGEPGTEDNEQAYKDEAIEYEDGDEGEGEGGEEGQEGEGEGKGEAEVGDRDGDESCL